MRRRIVLSGLLTGVVGALGSAARAQTASPSAAAQTSAATGDAPASGPSEAVKTHIGDTLAAGALSLLLSRVAQTKLRHPMTRQFADFEAAEQDGIADVLKSRMTPGVRPSGAARPPSDAEVDANLDDEGRAAVARFRDMAPGPEFEKSYVQAEVDGHKKLLGIQDAYLEVADNAAETDLAKLIKGRIQEHLVILGDIEKHLG